MTWSTATGGATAKLHQSQQGTLPGLLGFEWLRLDKETVEGRFDVRKATTADSISALIFVLRSARRK